MRLPQLVRDDRPVDGVLVRVVGALAGERVLFRLLVDGLQREHRPDDGEAVEAGGAAGQEFAEAHAGDGRGYRREAAADLAGGLGFRVERVVLAKAAGVEVDQTGNVAAAGGGCEQARQRHSSQRHPSDAQEVPAAVAGAHAGELHRILLRGSSGIPWC